MQNSPTFRVKEAVEFRDGTRLIAKYHSERSYHITPFNSAFVKKLIEEGKAVSGLGGSASHIAAPQGKVRGRITLGARK